MDRWPSGLRRSPAKGVRGKLLRGFESHPVRHKNTAVKRSPILAEMCIEGMPMMRRLAYPLLDQKAFPDLTGKSSRGVSKSFLGLPLWESITKGPILPYGKTISPFIFRAYLTTIRYSICALLIYIWFQNSMPLQSWRMVANSSPFSILTTVRPSEARLAQLQEFDLKVPWQRMKARHPHTVPLSDQVIDLIQRLRRQHNYPFVFHGRDVDKAL